jgi:hypothetical protein
MFRDSHTLQLAQAYTHSVPLTDYVEVDVAAAV